MLPSTITPPHHNVSDLTILVYGPPKIGKSSFAACFPSALFLATEAGLGQLEVFQIPIVGWAQFLEAVGEVARGAHPFRTIVIDTVDNLYRFCSEEICKKNGGAHESDLQYGKGYSLVNMEFHRVITKLSTLTPGDQ